MSSAVVSTSAAPGRLFVFDEETELAVCSTANILGFQSTIKNQQSTISFPTGNRQSAIGNSPVTPASHLEVRPAPEMVTSGIAALDALTSGLPRGCLTEICGDTSSGRTTLLLAALAAATRRGEFCAVVDASDALDPQSVAAAGVELERLLWVRCGENPPRRHRDTEKTKSQERIHSRINHSEYRLEQVLRATDLLLESGGFGLIALDLGDLPVQAVRRIPLTTWFRFRRAVEHKPTILLAIEQQPFAGSCSSLRLQLGSQNSAELAQSDSSSAAAHTPAHVHQLTGLNIKAELVRSRLEHKPVHSVTFASKTAWAG